MTKVCRLCGEEKTLDEFGKKHARCKECYKPIIAAQRASKMERYNAQRRQHYRANKERILAGSRERNARPEEKARKAEYNAEYRAKNRDHLLEADRQRSKANWQNLEYRARLKAERYLKRMGISLVERDAMLVAQGGRCAVCGSDNPKAKDWSTDHDHACCPGKKACGRCIRGILCFPCNALLGHARDNVETLRAGIAYLNAWENRGSEEEAQQG